VDKSKTRSQRIREILLEGPATSREIADSLEIPRRSAVVGIRVLRLQGQVKEIGLVYPVGMGRPHRIYELTARGKREVWKWSTGEPATATLSASGGAMERSGKSS